MIFAILFFYTLSFSNNGGYEVELEGQVLDPQGRPIEGAEVKIIDINLSRTTDKSGEYNFTNLGSGTYTIQVTAEGFRTLNIKLTLWADDFLSAQKVEKTFTLRPVSGDKKGPENVDESIGNEIYLAPTIFIIASTISFLGGILARMKKYWRFCVLAAFFGIFSIGFIVVSPILNILAMVILLRTRYAFRMRGMVQPPIVGERKIEK